MSPSSSSGADSSRDYYRLTYADPTGETAVRNLTGRTVQLSWENGATIHLDIDTIRPFLAHLEYQMSRKGHLWAKKNPRRQPGIRTSTPTAEKENQ